MSLFFMEKVEPFLLLFVLYSRMDSNADDIIMTEDQNIDIFATAVYKIVQQYYDITLYRPSDGKVVFYANPKLRTRGWKWKLKKQLRAINVTISVKRDGESYRLTIHKITSRLQRPPMVNILLFILTFLSVLLTASFYRYGYSITDDLSLAISGMPFAITLMGILLVHEMGHFWAGYKRQVVMSYPFFIPAPTLLGTFGAVIKGRTPIKSKNDLILIGASGPLAGAVPAIIALAIGYAQSTVTSLEGLSGSLYFGDSLLTAGIRLAVLGQLPANHTVVLSQIAQAGKVGLLVTMINLLPLGQLDGGHILYGLVGKLQHKLAILFLIFLAGIGTIWNGWWVWLALAIIMKPFHPPVINNDIVPDKRHKIMGWIAVILFILTFVPMPISFY